MVLKHKSMEPVVIFISTIQNQSLSTQYNTVSVIVDGTKLF